MDLGQEIKELSTREHKVEDFLRIVNNFHFDIETNP
jgi:hypothetical protein